MSRPGRSTKEEIGSSSYRHFEIIHRLDDISSIATAVALICSREVEGDVDVSPDADCTGLHVGRGCIPLRVDARMSIRSSS